ncbi:hypothetical protein Lbys_1366 [Leadbetterella byssophila DSM 17132]|uniref:Uncharacterized protein n=1 Tax=Leadbetterella byssophila (strain DSM 17132 / JCM 16389 / KACC 11308 / NBRC 106382 / 4M15) TaxID=649349 RepID=E4RVM1_LEAB4|nr:hypothetical protein [Leadbetterella byssophila]ADQ17085.1 hypothetical protein Lbys_1366 [Leadbetterella byssophila DSM 17132]
MKTFLVKNLIVVFALLLGIGTMSFKVIQKQNVSEHWYKVVGGIVLDESPDGNCQDDEGTVCAVAFSEDITPPPGMTVNDAYNHGSYAGEAKRNN